MIRFRGKVEYDDGSAVEFETGTAAVAAWERYAVRNKLPYGQDSPPTLSNLVIAHHALAIEQGFDAWLETVTGCEVTVEGGEGAAAVPPTEPEATTD